VGKKITDVSIESSTILRLNEDAEKGDYIDIRDLQKVDSSFIEKLIKEDKENEYQKLIENERKKWVLQSDNEKANIKNELEKQIAKLTNEKQSLVDSQEAEKNKAISEEKAAFSDEKNKLELEINSLKGEKANLLLQAQSEKDKLASEKDSLLQQTKADYEKQIAQLKADKNLLTSSQESMKTQIKLETENSYKDQINELKAKIDNLEKQKQLDLANKENEFIKQKQGIIEENNKVLAEKTQECQTLESALETLRRDRISTGVKMIGEGLETWCNNEYKSYANTGFINCTWDKDNAVVKGDEDKGTKADYIFRVYSSDVHRPENELTSVCLDMKSENPGSATKKKNADHYAKLDKDRIKKNCVYALLVSELESDSVNDTPILKVQDYQNMYMVRPAYFISFLSVIQSISLKYKDLINQINKDKRDFEESQKIIEEFNHYKDTYFDKPLETMNKKVSDIVAKSETIRNASESIRNTANEIINTTLVNMKTKFDRFDIQKIARSIDKLEDK